MKTIQYLSILFIFLTAGKVSAQQISSAELQVAGLTCSMCSQATEKSLRSLDFIEAIKPDLNKNIFVIDFKKSKAVSIDLIRKKVQDAGFSVAGLTAVFNFDNLKIDENGQAVAGPEIYKFFNAKNIPGPAFKQKAAQFKTDTYASGYGTINGRKTRIYHLAI
jgi:copper chaperone CopZ